MNGLLYAAWNVFFGVFTGKTYWTKKDFPSPVATTQNPLILN